MKDENLSVGVALAAILGFILLLPLGWDYGVFAYGYALSVLWGWFVVPILGLKALTWVQAAAILMVVRFVTSSHTVKLNSEADKTKTVSDRVTEVLVPLLSPWVCILFAWVFKVVFM